MARLRENEIKLRLKDDELQMLRALADADGQNINECLRQLIRRASRAVQAQRDALARLSTPSRPGGTSQSSRLLRKRSAPSP